MREMSPIEQVELQIQQSEQLKEMRERALRLSENPDFKVLFSEGYFVKEAARLVQMSTDPRLPENIRQSSLDEARATGFVKRYMSDLITVGYTAEQNLPELHNTIDEIRAEMHQ